MKNKEMKHLMKGAIILSVSGFIAKILSAVYRVPFQNMVGDIGFYVYQQVYPFYGIGMIFALTGLPLFVSKLVAETKDGPHLKRVLRNSFLIVSVFALFLASGLYFFAGQLANFMGDGKLTPLIQTVAPMFLVMPILVIGRGYFQGRHDMTPTAISQVVEQVVRVAIILFAAVVFLEGGLSYYEMGTKAMASAWIAGIGASIILFYYMYQKRRFIQDDLKNQFAQTSEDGISWQALLKRFATEGLAICLFSAMLVLLQLIDSFTLYKGLVESGLVSKVAQIDKGIYDRGQPLVQLGMVVGTGLASSLIPLLARHFVHQRTNEFARISGSLLRITLTFSVAATTGLIVLLPSVNQLLFSTSQGTLVLSIYVLAIVLASMIIGCNTILQSQNRHQPAFVSLMVTLFLKVMLNIWLVPLFGTLGASIATVVSLSVMLLLLWLYLPKKIHQNVKQQYFIGKLVFCALGMGLVVGVLSNGLNLLPMISSFGRIGDLLLATICIPVGIFVFLWLAIRVKLLTLKEWLLLPFGKKILRK